MSEIVHPIPPVFDEHSEILILGSFPSVKSREAGFFYGHPQNRFWKTLAGVLGLPVPVTVEEKRRFLLLHHIALWDVAARCEITGSADSSMKRVIPNDLSPIFQRSEIKAVFVNGKTAEKYYRQLLQPVYHREAVCLPSTSPANAARSLPDLIAEWSVIRVYLSVIVDR